MPHFTSYDGAEIAYRVIGDDDAPPLVCLAGGPGRDAGYLEDLGGLSGTRRLVVPDSRGTGDTPPAADPLGYSFPRLAEDVEALRAAFGLEHVALLAHGAAAATAQAYAASYPRRLDHLVLVAPGSRLQGELPDDARQIFLARRDQPWWPQAEEALRALESATDLSRVKELLARIAPMAYGRWDTPQRAHAATEADQWHPVPRAGFWQGVDEPARRALLERLASVRCPVLVVTGDRDAVSGMRAGELVAACFPDATLRPLFDVGHYPWIDEPELFRPVVEEFLTG